VKSNESLKTKEQHAAALSLIILMVYYHSSGCWPSWASHAHSPSAKSLNTAVKEESSGEHA
jgi:hypothetical protein